MGEAEVGKTCLIKRFCEGRFESKYIPTIGLDYGMQKVTVRNKPVMVVNSHQMTIFDLSGDPIYEPAVTEYFANLQILLVCYDATDKDTLTAAEKWINRISPKSSLKEATGFLVACKKDLLKTSVF